MEGVKGCLARIGLLALLAAAAGAGWIFRDRVSDWWGRLDEARLRGEPSEALARGAEQKLQRLATAEPPASIRLEEAELQSLLLFRLAPGLPTGIETPAVEVRDSTLLVTALLRPDRLQAGPAAQALRGLLSDSAALTAELLPGVARPGEGRLQVLALQAGSVVIPPLLLPGLLERLELPGTRVRGRALHFALPAELAEMRVAEGGLLVATAPTARRGREPDPGGSDAPR